MTTMNREEQKQVLIDTANHIIHRDNTSPYSENLRELARIALAALEVEPIGFRCRRNDNLGDWSYVYHREPDDFERKHLVIEGIYAAPPAPVPLTEVQRAMLRDMDVEISAELEEEEEIYRDGIRKCIAALRYHHKRAETCSNGYTGSTLEEDTLKSINFLKRNNIAAMLQGAKPVSQTYNLPELIEGMEVSIDVSTCDADLGNRYFGTVTEALELDTAKNGYILLVQDAEPNFDINGNSPVTPDGWISCSERIPAQDDWVLIYSKHGEYMAGQVQGEYVELSDGTLSWLGNALYWMLLPEPPQGVNDELA
ncbi:TPA: DUF551 domain-containing protein [Escherichia coli]|uniref:DUF551 domain-containing protein n=4 Tax=Escherichia coli TaxID=562 RepID=UPI00201AAD27|nr:DUF551 domain-containing protein [Escherichia coli]MCZ5317941.1 DUF551 domain-containing protein [Escherichia coli]MCZ5567183.1 DUF551 domain-containing protein [Escherichia coli]MCZ5833113.1 DUF551 domain-containing protein [Escherichia coli]